MKIETIQDFYNYAKVIAPKSIENLLKWVDEYKTTEEWTNVFKPEAKFHDLPAYFQIAAMMKYLAIGVGMDNTQAIEIEKEHLRNTMQAFMLNEFKLKLEGLEELTKKKETQKTT